MNTSAQSAELSLKKLFHRTRAKLFPAPNANPLKRKNSCREWAALPWAKCRAVLHVRAAHPVREPRPAAPAEAVADLGCKNPYAFARSSQVPPPEVVACFNAAGSREKTKKSTPVLLRTDMLHWRSQWFLEMHVIKFHLVCRARAA